MTLRTTNAMSESIGGFQPRRARREFLHSSGYGIGALALANLLESDLGAAPSGSTRAHDPLAAKPPHQTPRAKNVIFLHMVGAPSHLDLFDYKPVLKKHSGQVVPKHLVEGERFAFLGKNPKLLGTMFKFARHGDSGLELCEHLPHLGEVADDIAIVKSLHTEEFNHGPAQVFFQTGFGRQGRPSVGSWVLYGLGSEGRDLPGFVVLVTGLTPGGGTSLWGNGFLPSVYQGVQFRAKGDPVLYVSDPAGLDRPGRRRILDDIGRLNRLALDDTGDPEIAARIASYEMAFRMQTSVPGLMDSSNESRATHEMYGIVPGKPGLADNCLLARRLVERGVRFVQLYDQGWDHHGNLAVGLPRKCRQVDQPIAALVKDLKQRGLLDETLVVFAGEFGRTPMQQGANADGSTDRRVGRDHHKDSFAIWMAGGGIKGGTTVGRTDDLGYRIVEDPVHVHDLHATILHLLGLEHTRLTHTFQGRKYRLTDIAGNVVHKLFA